MQSADSAGATKPLFRGAFLRFLIGRTIDLAGSAMTPIVLPLAILEMTGSITDMGLVAAASLIPTLVMMLLGGVVADRFNRRSVLALTSFLAALVQAAMGCSLIGGFYSLPLMAGLAFASGVITAFNSPALRGIVPELVRTEDIQRANAALSTSRNAVRIGAPLLAGLLVSTTGGGPALLIDAATSIVAGLYFTRVPGRVDSPRAESVLQSLKLGWSAFASTPWIWISSVSFALFNALNVAPFQILGSAIITPVLGALAWGVLLSSRTVGMIGASGALLKWSLRKPMRTGRMFAALSALPLFGFWASENIWVLVVLAFGGGLGFAIQGVTYDSLLHARVPTDVLSRVSSFDDLLSYIPIPLSQLLIGPLANHFGAKELSLWCSIGLVLVTLGPLALRSVRSADQ